MSFKLDKTGRLQMRRIQAAAAGLVFVWLGLGSAKADVVARAVDYQSDKVLEGYLAFDDGPQGKRPGVLVVHTKRGIGEFIEDRTRELAKGGYVAFAADMYGKGIRPTGDAESTAASSVLKADRPLVRKRIRAAYDLLKADPRVDPERIAVIGYCEGGMVALELARSGAPLVATAVFHGTLNTPTPQDAKDIHGRVLVMHGADDQVANLDEVMGFVKEMRAAHVKFDLDLYGGVIHGFTEPKNGHDLTRSTAYDPRAAKLSWTAMTDLLQETTKAK
jgi:dienelactone hydrolase